MSRSLLRFIPKSSVAVPIDWSKVPEESRKYCCYYALDEDGEPCEERSLPQTIGDLAKSFHGCKVFGYLGSELCQLLLDISEFGLKKKKEISNVHDGLPVGPRFYMKYGDELWFLLFSPGDKAGASGCSAKLPVDRDDDAEAEKDKELAENFDKKLVDEVKRMGTLNVLLSKRLAGWEAYTMKSNLEQAQLADAMMSLPLNHPHRLGYMDSFRASLSRR